MNPYERYKQQMVTTMTQGDMLLRLYDETSKQIDIARAAIAGAKVQEMDKAINKAEAIIRYLRAQLDFRYPVSGELAKLYDFFNVELVMASVKKDVRHLDDIAPLVRELRETFDQCVKIERVSRVAPAAGAAIGQMV